MWCSYKIEHGVGGNAYDLWTGGGENADDVAHHTMFQTGDHFVSDKISSMWEDAGTYLHAAHAGVYVSRDKQRCPFVARSIGVVV